ncbi:hypothetical protein GCM10027605_14390 [Micromonospora zhanjiangensis]
MVGEGGAGDVGGDHPGWVGVGVGVDDVGGVEAADFAGGGDLAAEAGAEGGVGAEFGSGDLDRDGPAAGERPL